MRIKENSLCSSGNHRVPQPFLTEGVIGGDDRHRLRAGSVEDTQPVKTSGGKDMDSITLDHPEFSQARTDIQSQFLELIITDVIVGAKLEEGPVLVDLLLYAIDYLLNLLSFLVSADQTSRAHSPRVAKLGHAHAEKLISGGDIVGGCHDKAIFGQRVSPRDGLAFNRFCSRYFDGERWLRRGLWRKGDVL